QRPFYSSYAADLTEIYTDKVKKFIRSFHFFNMDNSKIPAVIVVADQVTSADPAFRKYWQINTLQKPQLTGTGAVLTSNQDSLAGKMYLDMLQPAKWEAKVYGGKDTHNVFGKQYFPPEKDKKLPEANGFRIQFTPAGASDRDSFLAVMQITDGTVKPLKVLQSQTAVSDVLEFGNRVISINRKPDWIRETFTIKVHGESSQILATGLAAGPWTVKTPEGNCYTAHVEKGKNSLFLTGGKGEYTFIPEAQAGTAALPNHSSLQPVHQNSAPEGGLFYQGNPLSGIRMIVRGTQVLVPAEAALKAMGAKDVKAADGFLNATLNGEKMTFCLESGDLVLNGSKITLPEKTAVIDGKWYVPLNSFAVATANIVQLDMINMFAGLTPMPENLRHIGWITSRQNPNITQLQNMLINTPGKTWYWDAEGEGAGFEVGFRRVMELEGVGLAFLQGSRRIYKFDIEVSNGGPWEKVFSGRSSGKTDEVEYFRFPVRKVQKIRFTGGGNSENQWNSIYTFVPLEKK
ncbi:MAG: hypothetical protein IJC34_05335, partial [Lentisphaeria bacterium]|nr:hypothetical protein [Lentisphaeria bacterium]